MKPSHWASIGETGALWGLRFMFRVYHWLGRTPFRLCLYPVILYYFLIHRGARQASLDYLGHLEQQGLLPDGRSLAAHSYRHFLNFGESMLDKLAVWQGDITLEDIRFVGHQAFDELADNGRGGLLIGSHLGNLEICRALAQRNTGMTFNVLMHTAHATRFNEMLRRVSGDSHVNIIQVSDINPATAIVLQQKLDAGEFLVIAGDRTPVSGEGNTREAPFLGEAADFPVGPFILASILRCPVLSIFCLRQEEAGKPGYDLYIEPFAERLRLPRKDRHAALDECIQRWAERLEHYCALAPLQWYNFYDFWARPGRQLIQMT